MAQNTTNPKASKSNTSPQTVHNLFPFDTEDLTAYDLTKLEQAYITQEIAENAFIRRVHAQDGAQFIGRKSKTKNDYSGWIIPNFWPGMNRPRDYRLRRDNPDLEMQPDGTTKEKGKYLSSPGGSNLIYIPPNTDPAFLTDPAIPITITEGEKKSLALARFYDERNERQLCIGLPGVWNWRGTVAKTTNANNQRQNIKGVIPDLGRIEWQEREVWIVFDVNAATNSSVAAARHLLAKELTRRGALVRILDLPNDVNGVNGIDDLLACKGPDFVAALFANSTNGATRKASNRTIGSFVFVVDAKSLWAVEIGATNKIKVSAALRIEADTRNARGESWGKLLVFCDREGREKSWVMPYSMLAGDKSRYREKLLDMGLAISPGVEAERLLHMYLHDQPDTIALSVDHVGWADEAFVFPDATIGGKDGQRIYLQASSGVNNLLGTSGAHDQWQQAIGRYCIGNSRLVFVVGAAFAAPLLTPYGISGGGFHFMGKSSMGKSTSQYVAGSVWGGGGKDGYVQGWKATSTGLEYLSEYHNDNLLCLDEIGEANPKDIGQSVYMIANGRGKHRGQAGGGLRKQSIWNVLAISSGEKTLSEYMAEDGQKMKEGQEVRLINILADAGAGLGLFENLHGFDKGKDFSDHLRRSSLSFYGNPIRAFLDQLINQDLITTTRQRFEAYKKKFLTDNLTKDADEIAGRAADRFAIVGFAGELASEWGITGWPVGEATKAASRLFKDWIAFRGQRDGGEDAGVLRVTEFIQRHGSSRFQYVDDDGKAINGEKIINRAGFKKYKTTKGADGKAIGAELIEYAIFPEVFKTEVCNGFDDQQIINVARRLKALGLLAEADGNNLQAKRTLGEFGRKRYFVIKNQPDDENEVGQVGQSDATG